MFLKNIETKFTFLAIGPFLLQPTQIKVNMIHPK